jgi:hypothetical protein
VTTGLVCIFSVLEPCRSFAVVPNRMRHRLEIVRRKRKCLHYYLYLIDPEFGWMHVRIQSWAPYEIQIYVNGREWLARQMDRAGIGYQRSENKIIAVDDVAAVKALCDKLAHTEWPAFLDACATMVNPLLPSIKTAGFSGYWWVIDQCEYAIDVLFRDRAALEAIKDDLITASVTALGASDVMHFLGRKPHHRFAGEVMIDSKKRPQGCRVRFRLKANAVKFYDHANVLRIETTINNPREFKVLRSADETGGSPRWCPMTKGVAVCSGRDQASIAVISGVTPRWPMPPTDVSWRPWARVPLTGSGSRTRRPVPAGDAGYWGVRCRLQSRRPGHRRSLRRGIVR